MQDYREIEDHYKNPDPWGVRTNPDDKKRRERIVLALETFHRVHNFKTVLDIGAGEGFITQALPGTEKYAFELSQNAAKRLPDGITWCTAPQGKYDLVTATGVLYPHYNIKLFFEMMNRHAGKVILTCNLKDDEFYGMENPAFSRSTFNADQVYTEEFPYCGRVQKLRIFKVVS